MRSAKPYAFRLSSKPCSTCEDLRRLAVEAIDSPGLQNLEEELKQTSAVRKLICYAIHAHLTDQHSQTPGVRLAA